MVIHVKMERMIRFIGVVAFVVGAGGSFQFTTKQTTFLFLQEGDGCTREDGANGTCVSIAQCQSALKGITDHNVWPTVVCGTEGEGYGTVCCDVSKPTTMPASTVETSTTAATVPARISPALQNRISQKNCRGYVERPRRGGKCDSSSAAKHELAHTVNLGFADSEKGTPVWRFGGSLISERYVLSCAQCARTLRNEKVTHVRLGATNSSATIIVKVISVIFHPDYDRTSGDHDISLVKLDRYLDLTQDTYNQYIYPACIHVGRALNDNAVTAAWWDMVDSKQEQQTAEMSLMSRSVCHAITNKPINDDTIFCAVRLNNRTQNRVALGDPLQQLVPGSSCMYSIVGITSFGYKTEGRPIIYMRVSAYTDWIEKTVWPTPPENQTAQFYQGWYRQQIMLQAEWQAKWENLAN